MGNTPCYNCENRKAGCHSECEKYILWKAANNEERAKRIQAGRKESEIKNYKINGLLKTIRRKKGY